MERKLNTFGVVFAEWCRSEQARLLEQIRWLETGSRHVAARTGNGPWMDTTENELMRLRLNFDRLDQLVSMSESEVVV